MYPDFNSSFHFLGYIKERDDLDAIPGMKRIPEFWAQPQGNFRSHPVTAWLLYSDKLGGWVFLFKSNIYLLRRNTLKINSFACHVKCAGKQISVMEAQRAVTVLLAGCSGESTCSSLVTRNSLPCHSSENTSGQKGRGLGHWLFFPTHSGKYSVAASPSRCRRLPCPYSRSGLELCINFSLVHAWASLPKVLLAEVGASCICRVANQTNLTLKQNRGWSTWLHRCSPYIMFPLIIEFWFVGLVDSLKKRKA